jgi:GNAT superfamily N-acetyltransferase
MDKSDFELLQFVVYSYPDEGKYFIVDGTFDLYQKLFQRNPTLMEKYRILTNECFKQEIGYNADKSLKRIQDYDPQQNMIEHKRHEHMVILYDKDNNDIITSLSYGYNDDIITLLSYGYNDDLMGRCVGVYSLFTNPTHYRKGYGYKLTSWLINLQNEAGKKTNCVLYISSVYSWNKPSLYLFNKLQFNIINVDKLSEDETKEALEMRENKELQVGCQYGPMTLMENQYFVMLRKFVFNKDGEHIATPLINKE